MRALTLFTQLLSDHVRQAGLQWPDKASLEPPKDKKFGDLASNLAMVLAGQAKAKPRDIAQRMADDLATHPEIDSVEIAGPGFVNVTFSPAFWQQSVPEILRAGDEYGHVDVGAGKKVQVEYVSANPTGPLHIGHGRGAALGDSIARILRFTGHDVETEYYLNDAGRQMNLLGMSVWVRLKQSLGMDVALPEDCYKGDYIEDIAADVLKDHPELADAAKSDDADVIASALDICRVAAMTEILNGIKKDLADFGVEHQVWFSELSLVETGVVEKTLAALKEQGRAYEEDGAFWFKSTLFGDDKDRVLRKSDGSLTYFASDIAYHANKYARGFDLVVDVWGADHHGYIPRMKAAVEALGKSRDALEVVLVQLVNLLRGGEQIAMSTRAGEFETLADVVHEVGSDAARFIFLSRKSDSKLDFDLELVKAKTMDNPVFYVQYAHARIHSLMRKAVEEGRTIPDASDATPETLAALNTPEDIALLRLLDQFPDAVSAAARTLSPHHVSGYLLELAGSLHRYYTAHPVLAAGDERTVVARLLLLATVAQVVRTGLGLLGVSAPDRM
ncbi:arginine--tRNA ligase [Oceanidesulfovibrio marinus]|uniref:Arginine--tRNA ligase n=1 Tax=Oceanidesulfovibrio marinus TaxID=370038 RepID=A0A6P1ZIE2_9BACT|nr:arginine--tRNA ligase [Oceanidesulfovibrio marinus]TVM34558.1 arginine--tRNA ligase [Oceanidesulfovibrio marinus]